jgi:hypothetical protein
MVVHHGVLDIYGMSGKCACVACDSIVVCLNSTQSFLHHVKPKELNQ